MFIAKVHYNDILSRLEKLEQARDCAAGRHLWRVAQNFMSEPYIMCKHCYAKPS